MQQPTVLQSSTSGTGDSSDKSTSSSQENQDRNVIPDLNSFYARHLVQPDKSHILVSDTEAIMSYDTSVQIRVYNHTKPSGVYPGRMWRQCLETGESYLLWFSEEYELNGIMVCNIESRKIRIFDWQAMMGVT